MAEEKKNYFEVRYSFRIMGATLKEQELFKKKFEKAKGYRLSIRPALRDQKTIIISLGLENSSQLRPVAALLSAAKIKGKRCQVFVSLNTDIETSMLEVDAKYLKFLSAIEGSIVFSYTVIVP